jgi:PAS domain S-box-containing protein
MNTDLEETADAAETVESLRLELERCQRELEECRQRKGQLEQAEALLAGENRLLEMVARGCSLPETLGALCLFIEGLSSGSLCGILLVDPAGNRVEHGAAPSLPQKYNEAIHGRLLTPDGGPCGMAACLKKQVVAADLASDTRWDTYEWRALAMSHGLRACWSTPILSSIGNVLGTFAIYWREPRSPASEHQKIIQQITHLAAVAIERKRTEAALQESEERFRQMADTIPEVIWFTALEPEKVLYVSPSFERIWGLPVENLYRNPRLWTETIHPDDRERVTSTFSRWMAGEQVSYHNVEYRIVRPDGAIRWIHEHGVLSLDEQGKARLASGISTDITEGRWAEDELRRSEAYLAEAQKLSRTGSFGWCVASGELIWSAETFCILGYDPSIKPTLELVFKRVHPDDAALVKQTVERATRDGTDFDVEHRLLMPDGSVRHVHIVARATKAGSGAIEFVGAVMDVTEQRNSAESRESAVLAERNRMARDIHDTLAQGFTGVIVQLEAAADAKSKGLAKEADEHLSRAGELARESLREARRSVRALRPQVLEAKSLCAALEDLVGKMTAGTSLRAKFISQGAPRKLPQEWEENLLRIGQEVLTNALRHAQAGVFTAQLVFRPEGILLELRDNGRGFDPAGKHDGFGLLGMKERVEEMGGQITIQSANGEGTTILITLPLTDNPPPSKS